MGKEITAIDIATGKPVWKKPIEADEQIKWFEMQDNKDTGEEVDKLILNDARPVYKVDDVENRVLYADKNQILIFEPKNVRQ